MKSDYKSVLSSLGADSINHHGRMLTDHLIGTSQLLAKWGNPKEVIAVGAFHSIYGTEEFKNQAISLDRRSEIAQLIGDEAEHLVYLFSVANRRAFYEVTDGEAPFVKVPREGDRKIPISKAQYKALLELEAANIVDQALHHTGVPESVVSFWFEAFRSKRHYLSEGAVTETDDILGIALKGKPHNSSLNRDGKTTCRPLARR
jgi:hypothetical protein